MGMIQKVLFKKNRNILEGTAPSQKNAAPQVPDRLYTSCPGCKGMIFSEELAENQQVCPRCGHHFRIDPRRRIALLCDEGSFEEWDKGMTSSNPLGFPGYENKQKSAFLQTRENEGVVTGRCRIGGEDCVLFVMNPFFMMGSMGSVVGEKITRAFERAMELGLPVVGYTVSGGARMQEGMLSLTQMAKTSGAVKLHSDQGGLYIVVLTDPTTGGVTASFGMAGDIILSEPKALVGFAGPRVIEQTIRQKLPAGFQRAEFLVEKGFVDGIVPRPQQKERLALLLSLHRKEGR